MKLRYKIWLEQDGKAFGDGPLDILKRIENCGSLRQAAAQINMSYSQAWNLVKALEKRLGFALLKRKVGGESGGGSELTSEARELMDKFERFRAKADKLLIEAYEEVFNKREGSF